MSLSWIDAIFGHISTCETGANGARSRKPRPRPKVLALDPDSDESDDSDGENCWSKLVEQTRHVLNRLMMQTFRSVPPSQRCWDLSAKVWGLDAFSQGVPISFVWHWMLESQNHYLRLWLVKAKSKRVAACSSSTHFWIILLALPKICFSIFSTFTPIFYHIFPWFSYDFPMVFLWFSHKTHHFFNVESAWWNPQAQEGGLWKQPWALDRVQHRGAGKGVDTATTFNDGCNDIDPGWSRIYIYIYIYTLYNYIILYYIILYYIILYYIIYILYYIFILYI